MKSRSLLIIFTVCFLLAVCNVAMAKDRRTVQRGMSKQEVLAILGEPENTSFNQYGETWEYYKSGGPLHYDKRMIVGFDADEMVSSYRSVTLRPENETQNVKVEHVPTHVEIPVPVYQGNVYCMDDNSFSILYNKVKNASFDSNKYDLIEVASLGGYFSCNQCASIMRMFTFDDKKLKVLQFMGPHIVDPENANDIYRLFDFNSAKEKAARIIQGR